MLLFHATVIEINTLFPLVYKHIFLKNITSSRLFSVSYSTIQDDKF